MKTLKKALSILLIASTVTLMCLMAKPSFDRWMACSSMEEELTIELKYPQYFYCEEVSGGYEAKATYLEGETATVYRAK